MTKLKIEIKTFGGSVLFSFEKENNSIKDTLIQAVKEGAYLQGAYLRGAYLRGADLQGADLRGADLRGADLQGADLQGAYLQGAYLRGAYLQGAYLRGAYLRGADLRGADLQGADLRGADLQGADLRGAYLRGADLRGADLQGADLRGADLQGADLRGAYLRGAYLQGAYLRGADEKNLPEDYINQCSRDMLFVFEHLKHELPYLRQKLVEGKVNGSQCEGECACLIGSLGKGKMECVNKVVASIPYYKMGLQNMGEVWFLNIKEGDTVKDSFFVRHAIKLIDMVLEKKTK